MNPNFLWSLLGLAIPIAIHLLSRKEGQLIRLGSIRHVHETSTQQFKGLRLNEVLLLFLRCALVILFAFLISGLSIPSEGTSKWLLVERALASRPRVRQLADSLARNNYEVRLLASGFPFLEDSASYLGDINYRKLANDLAEEHIASAIVLSVNRLVDFDGKRNGLPPNVRWISEASQKNSFSLQAVKIADSILVRHGFSNANQTIFTTKAEVDAGNLPIKEVPNVSIALIAEEKYAYDHAIMKAALGAIAELFQLKIVMKDFSPESFGGGNYDWIIWMSDHSAEDKTAKQLTLRPYQTGKTIEQVDATHWILTSRLNEEVVLKSNFTSQLAMLILPGRADLEQISAANDRRSLPDSLAWSSARSTNKNAAVIPEPANKYLLILFLIVLAVERMLSSAKNQ
jgi:hypothetical protein